ncbi:twin-arginine translocase subunit TatC [Natranaeroarchaeum sulfidigenes]|uniref:Sec-independent protein translocase protein TatC n=1 Tax=Natranaeroarchaeum sulfidigenes TaxID=2784880 RepID=A0A897MWB2_9EURY|nr:twin-arginine translocase subunit TatC [Natranaeroarchaeum sulfidigenes]QSG04268.1 Sec-independent protein secretion pathway component TatC [Natranaeroarchaeum sulfidigenes]
MGEDPTEEGGEDLPDDEHRDAPDESSDSDADADDWGGDGPDIDEGSTDGRMDSEPDDENAAATNWGNRSKPARDRARVAKSETESAIGSEGPADADDDEDVNGESDEEPDDIEVDEKDADNSVSEDPESDEETSPATAHDPDADMSGQARTDGSHATSEMTVPESEESGSYEPTTPPDDQEMPLTEHIEEMVQRLAVVLFAAAIVTLAVFPFASDVIIHMWYDILPQTDIAAPHVYGPLEHKLTELKLASIAGLALALPIAVYQTYLFMRPGLYPHERRYYLAAVPTSLVLAIVGMAFAYYLILPGLFEYFLYYSDGAEEMHVAFGLRDTFGLIITMLGLMAVVFQIPLCVMLAIMMGITSREWLTEHRLYFWGAFLGIAFLFSPDPTGMAPLIVAITMVGLFEGTLLLVKWTGR